VTRLRAKPARVQFLQRAAIRPVAPHAVVDDASVGRVEAALDPDAGLEATLDRGYRELDRTQPTLAHFVSEAIATREDDVAQSLGYFLAVAVYLLFREAFPTRLGEIDADALAAAIDALQTDEALRAETTDEVLESDDVVAMGQPAVLDFVQHHVREAVDVAGARADLAQLDDIYRLVLIEVIALSHCVAPPDGEPPVLDGEVLA
jgi:hypothetical protein